MTNENNQQKQSKLLSILIGLVAAVALNGCGANELPETSADEPTSQEQQLLRTDCCYAACYDGKPGITYYNLGRIGDECRAHAVAICHANHWAFKDAKWDACH